MAGIEEVGLALGALPVLIAAIDGYKRGISKAKIFLKNRKAIEKLGRALRCQQSIIEGIARNVLRRSGCDDAVGANITELRSLLQDKQVRERIDDLLGPDDAEVFLDALVDCMGHVGNVTIRLASLVPELAPIKDDTDVQAILKSNEALKKGQIQLSARISMVFKHDNLEHAIKELDQSTNTLDKITRNITANYPGQNVPSRKAVKLAKALQVVRQNAVNLHSALRVQWATPCHQRHELKVFLEDRLVESKPSDATDETRVTCFKVVFVCDTSQLTNLWHETLFYIDAEEHPTAGTPRTPRIQFSTPQRQSASPRLDVKDICGAITGAACTARYPVFYLASTKNIAMTLHAQAVATTRNSQSSSTTLHKILDEHSGRKSFRSILPWKWRMVLALKIASSFLQFIRTPWVQHSWSASKIHIPYMGTGQGLGLDSPFMSTDFSSNCSSPANKQTHVKEDLLELGILLLEIWHENNLETQFGQQLSSNIPLIRRACALQWLEDLQNPLPDLYYRAACHCISAPISPDPRTLNWDRADIWKSVCENVIDPLAKVAQI